MNDLREAYEIFITLEASISARLNEIIPKYCEATEQCLDKDWAWTDVSCSPDRLSITINQSGDGHVAWTDEFCLSIPARLIWDDDYIEEIKKHHLDKKLLEQQAKLQKEIENSEKLLKQRRELYDQLKIQFEGEA